MCLSACQWATRACHRRQLQKISPPLACSLPSTAPLCAGEQQCSPFPPIKAREDKPVPFCTDQAVSGVKIAKRKKNRDANLANPNIPVPFLLLSEENSSNERSEVFIQ